MLESPEKVGQRIEATDSFKFLWMHIGALIQRQRAIWPRVMEKFEAEAKGLLRDTRGQTRPRRLWAWW